MNEVSASDAASRLNEAKIQHREGRLDEAERLYREILARAPINADALHYLGVLNGQRGNLETAAELLKRAADADPSNAAVHYNLANALRQLERWDEAIASYDAALSHWPDHIAALTHRVSVLCRVQRFAEALEDCDRALALDPLSSPHHFNRANVLRDLGRTGEALAAYERALELDPCNPSALNNRGSLYLKLMHFEEAAADFAAVLAIAPDHFEALVNYGNALLRLQRYAEALASCDQAIALRPDSAHARKTRGSLYFELGEYDRAFADYDAAFLRDPDLPYLEGTRLYTKMLLCEWSGLDQERTHLRARVMQGKQASEPFPMLAISPSEQEQLICAGNFAAQRYPAKSPAWSGEIYGRERIRVAYVSGEFREQATAYLTAELFECHDRNAFELHAISAGPQTMDPMRCRLEAAFDNFADLSRASDDEIAAFVRRAEIDILINLNGYFGLDRTGVFALRPAPIQVNYLGFPGTMGATYMDYIIADRFTIPERAQKHYIESIAYLPECYQPNDRKKPASKRSFTRGDCGLPEAGFVFCCFNNSHKLTPAFFDVWMRLLNEVSGSVLWLYEGHDAVKRNLRREAVARGVAPGRLVFAPPLPLGEHLGRVALADLFLDTQPHNAHTTASDALWCGVPVLTCSGETFAGRVAASLLHAIGLPELITDTREDYQALALRLARDPGLLATIKANLSRNRGTTPLFDTPRYARNLERAYRHMWMRARRGLSPQSFAVEGEPA